MGAYVPIFKKIHKLLLPFAYYFCRAGGCRRRRRCHRCRRRVHFEKWITFLCFDRFGSYLVRSCTGVRRFTSYPIFVIRPPQPAQPAYRPKSEKRA